ncbi:hypothetical protein niasHT_029124 [Heterodera trifolii]|uniref:CCHC-type domain-containing protein n=1 Tax=Heterodera trifolii TaxID=157864 RepID=A0ABD2KN21_9BILA
MEQIIDGRRNPQLTAAIQQLLANQNAAPAANAHALPTLPTIDCFEPSDDRSISDWLERFNFALDCAAPQLADEAKVKLLMTKLSEVAFSQYSKSGLPKKVIDFDYSQTEERLKIAFSRPQSIWIDRYECLRASKSEDESFRPFINRHKRLLDADLRKRILSKLAADFDLVAYGGVVEDLQMYQSTIAEAKVLEQQPMGSRNLMATKLKTKKKLTNSDHSSKASSISTGTRSSNQSQRVCWRCGLSHSSRHCRHETTVCRKCKKSGHLERMCAKHQAWLKKNGGKKDKAVNNIRVEGVFLNALSTTMGQLVHLLAKERQRFHLATVQQSARIGHDGQTGLSDSIRNGLKDKSRTETAKANGESQNKKFFRKDRRGKKQNFFAVGASVIASLGDEPWRAGRVISRNEGTYDVQFLNAPGGEAGGGGGVRPGMEASGRQFKEGLLEFVVLCAGIAAATAMVAVTGARPPQQMLGADHQCYMGGGEPNPNQAVEGVASVRRGGRGSALEWHVVTCRCRAMRTRRANTRLEMHRRLLAEAARPSEFHRGGSQRPVVFRC